MTKPGNSALRFGHLCRTCFPFTRVSPSAGCPTHVGIVVLVNTFCIWSETFWQVHVCLSHPSLCSPLKESSKDLTTNKTKGSLSWLFAALVSEGTISSWVRVMDTERGHRESHSRGDLSGAGTKDRPWANPVSRSKGNTDQEGSVQRVCAVCFRNTALGWGLFHVLV